MKRIAMALSVLAIALMFAGVLPGDVEGLGGASSFKEQLSQKTVRYTPSGRMLILVEGEYMWHDGRGWRTAQQGQMIPKLSVRRGFLGRRAVIQSPT